MKRITVPIAKKDLYICEHWKTCEKSIICEYGATQSMRCRYGVNRLHPYYEMHCPWGVHRNIYIKPYKED
jgi:hypothetical protein